MSHILRTSGTKIVDAKGKPIRLQGVNLGGWLMMEAYIMHAPNFPERGLKERFAKFCGAKALKDFEEAFRANFIREDDFARVARMGFNCVRLPFNGRLIEPKPYTYSAHGAGYLDTAIKWAKKHGLYVILDLHAAPGSQNPDWHSDSFGKAELWTSKANQNRVYRLWEFLADRYKDEATVAGYDILNEAILKDTRLLNHFYKNVIKAIRRVDQRHILFIEGSNWAQDLACLDEFEDENYVLSAHYYIPAEFCFNFIQFLKYPMPFYTKSTMRKTMEAHYTLAQKRRVPVHLGEFGVNNRQGHDNEHLWVKDMLSIFKEFDFHWTYWTFKAIKGPILPDGLFSYMPNPPWVNRFGPLYGWDTWHKLWKTRGKEIARSWRTEHFTENKIVTKVLKNAL